MIVTIFGATGMVGKQLITHCLAKKWNVRAFGRNISSKIDFDLRHEEINFIHGYIFDGNEVKNAIKGADAVLSALGGAIDGKDKARSLGMKNIVTQMEATGVSRIVALGGKGVLPGENGMYIIDQPDYPQEFVPVGKEHVAAFEYLDKSTLQYTFVCSPDIIPAEADNHFEVKVNEPVGTSGINAGNLALFMVEELERNQYVRQRVGIANTI